MDNQTLKKAQISFDIAIIPSEPLKSQIALASQSISENCENRNLIDNKKFPAHLSLYLGGSDRATLALLAEKIEIKSKALLGANFKAEKITCDEKGFVSVKCQKDKNIESILSDVVKTCSELHLQNPQYRPRVIDRWDKLTPRQQANLKQYGTYDTPGDFEPHLSVADVSITEILRALEVSRRHIMIPQDFTVAALQIVDIGHANEKWDVLYQWQ